MHAFIILGEASSREGHVLQSLVGLRTLEQDPAMRVNHQVIFLSSQGALFLGVMLHVVGERA